MDAYDEFWNALNRMTYQEAKQVAHEIVTVLDDRDCHIRDENGTPQGADYLAELLTSMAMGWAETPHDGED